MTEPKMSLKDRLLIALACLPLLLAVAFVPFSFLYIDDWIAENLIGGPQSEMVAELIVTFTVPIIVLIGVIAHQAVYFGLLVFLGPTILVRGFVLFMMIFPADSTRYRPGKKPSPLWTLISERWDYEPWAVTTGLIWFVLFFMYCMLCVLAVVPANYYSERTPADSKES